VDIIAKSGEADHSVAPFTHRDTREKQFRQVFERYYRPIHHFFGRRGFDPEECRDLTQETFLRVYRGMGSFRGEAGVKTWLFTIAANIYRNEIRDRHAEKRSGDEVSLEESLEQGRPIFHRIPSTPRTMDPLSRVLSKERSRLLRNGVAGLPPRMRHCVRLRLDRGLKYREIASLLEVTEDTVKAQLFQARQKLRGALEDDLEDRDDDA